MSLPNPIVLLDARARYVHPALTCERASPKWLFGPDGQRHRVPENAMPWEYDPVTGELMGLRVESTTTNLIPDTDVDNWSKGNVTVSDAGDGWRRVEAQNTGSEGRSVAIALDAVTDGNYYTYSVDLMAGETPYGFLALSGAAFRDGSTAGLRIGFNIIEKEYAIHAEEEVNVDYVSFRDIGDGAVRMTFSALALNAEAPNCQIFLKDGINPSTGTSTLSAGDGLYVRAPQVEVYGQSTIANVDSSWIETTGSTATRSIDLIQVMLDGQPWFDRDAGTLVAEAIPWSRNISPVVTLRLDASVNTHGIGFRHDNVGWRAIARSATGSNAITAPTGNSFLQLTRGAIAYDSTADNFAFAVNGSVGEAEYPSDFFDYDNPSINIGRYHLLGVGPSSVCMDGWIRRVVYYPHRISNANLQSLTAMQE